MRNIHKLQDYGIYANKGPGATLEPLEVPKNWAPMALLVFYFILTCGLDLAYSFWVKMTQYKTDRSPSRRMMTEIDENLTDFRLISALLRRV